MSVLPESRLQVLEFCEARNPVWNAAPPASIGLTPAAMTTLVSLNYRGAGAVHGHGRRPRGEQERHAGLV